MSGPRIESDVYYSMVPEWVLDHEQAGLDSIAVRTYAVLARYGNSEGGSIHPSLTTIARRVGVSKPERVSQAIADLKAAGALEATSGKAEGKPNTYVLHFSPPTPAEGVPPIQGYPSNGGTGVPPDEGDDRKKSTERSDVVLRTTSTAQVQAALVAHFAEEVERHSGSKPLEREKGRVARAAGELLREGLEEQLIRDAITELVETGLHVGALTGVAGQLNRGGYRGGSRRRGLSARQVAELAAGGEL